jgi:hypothetical protein
MTILEEKLKQLLIEMGLTHNTYHGKLIINYQQGNIMLYTKEESIKLTEKRR